MFYYLVLANEEELLEAKESAKDELERTGQVPDSTPAEVEHNDYTRC